MAEVSELFDVVRFIGRGCYSLVYKAICNEGNDKDTSYALKRFFLQNSSAVQCALRERRILERLALEDYQSPFLPTLYYSFTVHEEPVFILREGNGCDLFDLLHANGKLTEHQARFYASELLSGLEHLHALGIVHLDLKPENVLLYDSGHIFISDFDRSYDLTRSTTRPTDDDFTGTPLFMAPEIARGDVITTKADVWSFAVLMAEMVSGPIRCIPKDLAEDLKWAKEGRFHIKAYKTLSKSLQAFFNACLQRKHHLRLDFSGVRQLRFFKNVNWDQIRSCAGEPPICPSLVVHRPNKEGICKLEPNDPLLLEAAYGKGMPITRKRVGQTIQNQGDGAPHLISEPPNTKDLLKAGMTPDALQEMFTDFTFINPVTGRLPGFPVTPRLKNAGCGDSGYGFDESVTSDVENSASPKSHRLRNRTRSSGD